MAENTLNFSKPNAMNFDASNVSAEWRKWKQNMQLYLDAVMSTKTPKEKYSAFLYVIGQRGRDIFNSFTFTKIKDENGVDTDQDEITVAILFAKFEAYCNPRRNLLLERRKFFQRDQKRGEVIDTYMTELRTMAANCEFGNLLDGMLLYRLVDGIQSDLVRDRILRSSDAITLAQAMTICRNSELSKVTMQHFSGSTEPTKEVDLIGKKKGGPSGNRNLNRGNLPNKNVANQVVECTRCNRRHQFGKEFCPAVGTKCSKCKKKDHFAVLLLRVKQARMEHTNQKE